MATKEIVLKEKPLYPPAIWRTRTGKRVASFGNIHIEISDEITRSQLEQAIYEHNAILRTAIKSWLSSEKLERPKVTKHEVIGSKGDKYIVSSLDGVNWRCTCYGYTYHRHCKHADKIKNETSKIR